VSRNFEMNQIVSAKKRVTGDVRLPGDKSISHRALMIASVAEGVSEIENLAPSADVQSTRQCLQGLGIKINARGATTRVEGRGLQGFQAPTKTLDVGNSGTTMRLLSGLLVGQPFSTALTGDDSIRRRPMSRIAQPLRQMGATIEATDDEFAPLTIRGGKLRPISYRLPVDSAQVKSCVLLAGLFAEGETRVIENLPTRDHTELMLQSFGAKIEKENLTTTVFGPAKLIAQHVYIPGDISSAAFLIAAALLTKESRLIVENIGINPTRRAILSVLMDMGASIEVINFATINNEFFADVVAKSSDLRAINIGGEIIPQIIDEIPILAILATQANGVTEISGAGELRVKESDRLHAVSDNLKRMAADVVEKDDGLIIRGPTPLRGAEIDSFNDHRIAMAFAIAGLIASGETTIRNSECADISFPGFFDILRQVAYD
jgi:3-phosphoshikimate 1-carboxyvinyltransferase